MDWDGPTIAVSGFYCKICDLTFPDQRNYNLHRSDRMHLQKCYQLEYNTNQPTSLVPDARQILALYSNDNTGRAASSSASFHSPGNLLGPPGRDIKRRFCESSGSSSNFNIRYQPQSSLPASTQTSLKKPKLSQTEEFKSPSLSLSPSSSVGSNVCSVLEKKPAVTSTLSANSTDKVCHKNNTLKDTLSKIKSLMGSLEKYNLLPKSTAIAASLDLDLKVLEEMPRQRIAKPSEGSNLSKINQKLCLLADGASPNVSLNNPESSGKPRLTAKGNKSPDCSQVPPREFFSRFNSSSVATTSLVSTSSGNVCRNALPNKLSSRFISPKNEAGRSMTKTTPIDSIPDTLEEGASTSGTVNKRSGKLSPNLFDRFSGDHQKNKTTASNPVASARKSLQSNNIVSKDSSQLHATNKSNDNKANASKLALLPTPPVNSFRTAGGVSSSEVKKPLLPVPTVALLPEPTMALLPEPTAALLPEPTEALLPEPKAAEAAKPAAVIHSQKLVSLQEKLKKTLESCEKSGGKKALTEEQVKDLEVNEMLILINTIMTKIIQDITKDRPSKFSVQEVLDCGINQRGDLYSALEKLFGRDKPHQLTELVKALKSIDTKVLQGLKELLEKDQGAVGAPTRDIPSSSKVQKGNVRGLLDKPETSTDLKNGSASQLKKSASGKYYNQSPNDIRALLPTPKGALLPTPNASGPRFRNFF